MKKKTQIEKKTTTNKTKKIKLPWSQSWNSFKFYPKSLDQTPLFKTVKAHCAWDKISFQCHSHVKLSWQDYSICNDLLFFVSRLVLKAFIYLRLICFISDEGKIIQCSFLTKRFWKKGESHTKPSFGCFTILFRIAIDSFMYGVLSNIPLRLSADEFFTFSYKAWASIPQIWQTPCSSSNNNTLAPQWVVLRRTWTM